MSQRLRCLHLSLRALEKVPAGSLLAPPRTAPASRRSVHASPASSSAQAQLAPRPALTYPGEEGGRPRPPRRESFEAPARERRDAHNDGHSYSADTRAEVSETLARHLDRLFEPLVFPPDLARRILTHASHRDAVHGHNQRLSFMGRRALEAYFLLFLHSTPTDGAPADHASIAERALNAYSFGEHVGSRWELGRVIRWTPPDREHAPHREPVPQHAPYAKRGVGLYKVTGTAVEAVVGGVFHQFGATAAHKLFHTRILPQLPHIPEPFRSHARELCERMGGEDALLLKGPIRSTRKTPQLEVVSSSTRSTPASRSSPYTQSTPAQKTAANVASVKADAPHQTSAAGSSPQPTVQSRASEVAIPEVATSTFEPLTTGLVRERQAEQSERRKLA